MKNSDSTKISYTYIFRFWVPLAATWLMMSVEGPFLAAIIARLAAEKLNLAAYGVAYAFALVAESPVIMLMSAATSLCRDADSYRRLRNFSLQISLAVTLLLALFLLPPIFNLVSQTLLGLPAEVADLTHLALLCLLPWPGAIGIRRFYQGVLIAGHKTRRVAGATLLRLAAMSVGALLLYRLSPLSGALIGALALSTGVVAETLLTRFLARQAVATILRQAPAADAAPLNFARIWTYYLPLALTPFIALAVHPLVTFFLGKAPAPLESLAVMPVIYGLTFVFRALGLSYQEVAIALLGEDRSHYRKIRNFAFVLGMGASAGLALIAWTPLNGFWFESVSGLSPQLSSFAALPLQIMAIFPALTVLVCFQRAILIVTGKTKPISRATALEAVGIISLLWLAMIYLPLSGALAATLSYVLARLLAVAALHRASRHDARHLNHGES